MAKAKTPLTAALGRLISAIQKVWGAELGEPYAEFSQDVMSRAHLLLQAGNKEQIVRTLSGLSLPQFLGEVWLQKHPEIKPFVAAVEDWLKSDGQSTTGTN